MIPLPILLALVAAGYLAWRNGLLPAGLRLAPPAGASGVRDLPGPSWQLPAAGAPYAAALAVAEAQNGIPRNLLARLIWQESRFNPAAVNKSGARGIAQIMPATGAKPGYGVPPIITAAGDGRTNAAASIMFAGRYLAALRGEFGNWQDALAAYNWGPGNLAAWISSGRPPASLPGETRQYVASIASSVPVA